MKDYFSFKVIQAFADKIYRESLLAEHLMYSGTEYFYDEVLEIKPDKSLEPRELAIEDRTIVFMEKGNELYIVPAHFATSLPLVVEDSFPCQIKKSDKRIWRFVTEAGTVYLPPNNDVNIREFTDAWNPIKHSEPQTWTFLSMLALATMHLGIKCCVSSAPAAGKGAHFGILNLIDRAGVVMGTPTIAKYETLLFYKKRLIINEMAKPKAEERDKIQDLALWLADQSVQYEKHSLAQKRSMNTLKVGYITNIYTYNRKRNLKVGAEFFDDLWNNPAAIQNRYPQFLVEGAVLEAFPTLSEVQAGELAVKYAPEIKAIISGLMGIAHAVPKQMHGYDRTVILAAMTPRQRANIDGLVDYIDAYSRTEDEFMGWLIYLMNAAIAYQTMLKSEVRADDSVVVSETPPLVVKRLENTQMEIL